MNPDDDPEARIRQLEQPLADNARSSELGGTQPPGYYVPPPPPPLPYGSLGSGGLYPAAKSSGNRGIWIVAAMFIVGMLILVGGIAAYSMNRVSRGGVVTQAPSTGAARASTSPGTGPSNTASAPSVSVSVEPAPSTAPPAEPSGTPPPGGTVSVTGVGNNRTIACADNIVSVSGVSNTVVITGHCARLTVSGVKNTVTIDSVDSIEASGLENQVTYHSGSPKISKSGQSNVVQHG
jgi:Protein of unknown function (DUF3060)